MPSLPGAVLAAALALPSQAIAGWNYTVSWLGEAPASGSFAAAVSTAVGQALDLWTRHLAGGADIEVDIEITASVPRATGRSATSVFVHDEPGYAVFEQGLAYKIRTGIDANGPEPDVHIQLNPDYFYDELWFNPRPSAKQKAVPAFRTDGVSVLAHEIGHALAFNGWWDQPAGQPPLSYASTWDHNTHYDGSALYFVGAKSVALYGAPVPITAQNNWHIGNAIGPGADLLSDLMNGISFQRGTRYKVSPLDLAMLDDMGVALAPVPEPPAWAMMLSALGLLAAFCARRRAVQAHAALRAAPY